jgi:hypothetical protein
MRHQDEAGDGFVGVEPQGKLQPRYRAECILSCRMIKSAAMQYAKGRSV